MSEPKSLDFGDVCVDVQRMAVTRGGAPVDLEPKVFDLLVFLVAHRDRLVTKDELLDGVWKDTFVSPNALTRAIAQLRKALGDDAEEPRYIETVSRRGYRFIAPLTDGPARSVVPDVVPEPPAPISRTPWRKLAWAAAGVTVLVALSMGWSRLAPRPSSVVIGTLTPERFSTTGGVNNDPALSPDGSAMAFVSDRSGLPEIYVSGLARGSQVIPITRDGGINLQPTWSPDGRWIAFHSNRRGGVWIVPATGGTPVQLVDSGSTPAWSPDSSAIAFSSTEGAMAGQSIIRVIQRDGTGLRDLTHLGAPLGGHRFPAWSNSGRFIAFTSTTGGPVGNSPWIVDSAGGEPRPVETTTRSSYRLQFAPDDKALFFSGFAETSNILFRQAFDPDRGGSTGAPTDAVLSISGVFVSLSISRSGLLAYGVGDTDINIWTIDIGANGEAGEPTRLTSDSVRNGHPDYSPDGRRLVFSQNSGGLQSLPWVMNEDGSERSLLVPDGSAGVPMWAPDGTRVLVQRGASLPTLWWVDLATRKMTEVTVDIKGVNAPRMSPDGRRIAYWITEPNGSMNTFTQALDGSAPVRVTNDAEAINYPAWSPDGQWLAVEIKRGETTHIGVVPSSGGPVEQLTHDSGQSFPNSWSPDGEHIAFAGQRNGVWNIWEVSRRTKVTRQLTHFTATAGNVLYPSWSPRGNRIAFERQLFDGSIWTARVF